MVVLLEDFPPLARSDASHCSYLLSFLAWDIQLAHRTRTLQDKIKKGFFPTVDGFKHIPFNDLEAAAAAITEQTAAIMIEGIQGEVRWCSMLAMLFLPTDHCTLACFSFL